MITLSKQEDIAKVSGEAIAATEIHKPELPGVLFQDEYFRLVLSDDKSISKRLLKNFSDIPADVTGDMFGQIYQYFLSNFAGLRGAGVRSVLYSY